MNIQSKNTRSDGLINFIKLLNPYTTIVLILKHHDLLRQLVFRNIELRYKGTFLGLWWSIAQPLMMLCIYTFVFSAIFNARWNIETGDSKIAFAIIMFCGMSVFNIFGESINTSCGVILQNPNYVKKVIFPLEILPIANVLSITVFGMIWFLLVLLGATLFLNKISWTILLFPVTLFPLVLISCGISFFVSSLTVYLKDIPPFVAVIIQILFFMTPIFYPIQAVPEKYRWILYINPLTWMIEQTRQLFIFGQFPNWWFVMGSILASLIIFQLGFAWFSKTKRGFADVL